MRKRSLNGLIVFVLINISLSGFSQDIPADATRIKEILDSLKSAGMICDEKHKAPGIELTTGQAIRYLQERNQAKYWKNTLHPLRIAIEQLVFESSHLPYDSAEVYLSKYPLDSLRISWDKFYIWEPLRFKVPVIPTSQFTVPADTVFPADTISALARPVAGLKDTSILVVVDTLREVGSELRGFPFTYFSYPYQSDSLQAAVNLLLDYLEKRDSTMIFITGKGDIVTPVWLNSRSQMMHKYWLKNDLNDSVTVWIGAPSGNKLGLYLEQGVSFRRPAKQDVNTDARIEIRQIDRSKLLETQKITTKVEYWKFRSEAAFALTQAALSNWVKGGENSVAISTDITGYADYNNKTLKITSNNFARLKFGLLKSGEKDISKNLDLLETNSKLNHKAFGKFDFSAIMLFKTQIAKGHIYPTDSTKVLVSKFFNPAVLTIGLGLDYKPNKTTSINFSPFSYKGTYVTDTTGIVGETAIDQTKYGIPAHKKAKNEPGASFMITNEFKPVKTVTITNRLQLFTNYIDKPQNIDIDWEMILTANLNWFTDVRFNTHLIFDDDTRTPVYEKDKNNNKVPVMIGEKQKKTARIQFKELLGFSFIFRF